MAVENGGEHRTQLAYLADARDGRFASAHVARPQDRSWSGWHRQHLLATDNKEHDLRWLRSHFGAVELVEAAAGTGVCDSVVVRAMLSAASQRKATNILAWALLQLQNYAIQEWPTINEATFYHASTKLNFA